MYKDANFNWCYFWHHVSFDKLRQLTKSPISQVREFSIKTKWIIERSIIWHCAEDGFYDESVSVFPTHLNVDIFRHPICKSHSTGFWISLRGNAPSVTVYSVHPLEKGNLGVSYIAILVTWKDNINENETNRQGGAIKLRKC